MGVSGLSTFLRQRGRPTSRRWIRQSGDPGTRQTDKSGSEFPRLVLDAWAAVHFLISGLHAPNYANSNFHFQNTANEPGFDVAAGVLGPLLSAFEDLINSLLRFSNGQLLVIFDGSLPTTKQKTRLERDSAKLRSVREAWAGRSASGIGAVVPPLLLDSLFSTLEKIGVRWIRNICDELSERPSAGFLVATSEADEAAAWLADYYFPSGPGETIILSNDTDFFCFHPSRFSYASLDSLSISRDAMEVDLYPPGYLATLLQIPGAVLPLFAGLVGNDHTGSFAGTLQLDSSEKGATASSHRRILDAAATLKSLGVSCGNEAIARLVSSGNVPDGLVAALKASNESYTVSQNAPPISPNHPRITQLSFSSSFYLTPCLDDPGLPNAWDSGLLLRRAGYARLGLKTVKEYGRKALQLGSEIIEAIELQGFGVQAAGSLDSAIEVLRTVVGLNAEVGGMRTLLIAGFASVLSGNPKLKIGNHELLALLVSYTSNGSASAAQGAPATTNRRLLHLAACWGAFLASAAVLLRTFGLDSEAADVANWDSAPFYWAAGKTRGGARVAELVAPDSADSVKIEYETIIRTLGDKVDVVFDYADPDPGMMVVKGKKKRGQSSVETGGVSRKNKFAALDV